MLETCKHERREGEWTRGREMVRREDFWCGGKLAREGEMS